MHSPLDRLAGGALDWLGKNVDRFDPYAAVSGSATHGKAKAALELALLCHCSARLAGPHGGRLAGATALVRALWQHPDFPLHFDAEPEYTSTYALIYTALAPDGIDDAVCRATRARLAPDFLSPRGKSPYQRLEIRYYADKAGIRHTIEPYDELVGLSRLVTLPAAALDNARPLTTGEAYALTHSSFYLGDFGRRKTGLTEEALERARCLVSRTLAHCVDHDQWDLAAELLLTQYILGSEPLCTPSGTAAVECLARAQRPDGSIPGRSARLSATESDGAEEFFRKAYHTTLVTALMALIISSARPS